VPYLVILDALQTFAMMGAVNINGKGGRIDVIYHTPNTDACEIDACENKN
jgi:hypothetical protein